MVATVLCWSYHLLLFQLTRIGCKVSTTVKVMMFCAWISSTAASTHVQVGWVLLLESFIDFHNLIGYIYCGSDNYCTGSLWDPDHQPSSRLASPTRLLAISSFLRSRAVVGELGLDPISMQWALLFFIAGPGHFPETQPKVHLCVSLEVTT